MNLDIIWDDQLLLGEDILHLEQWYVVRWKECQGWRSLVEVSSRSSTSRNAQLCGLLAWARIPIGQIL